MGRTVARLDWELGARGQSLGDHDSDLLRLVASRSSALRWVGGVYLKSHPTQVWGRSTQMCGASEQM
jgi:hypothetical protein